MALTAKLDMKQGQSLVMTPQLQQAIKLLQLSNIELSAFIESELEKNPLLALENGLVEENSAKNQDPLPVSDTATPSEEQAITAADTLIKTDNSVSDLDTDFANIVPDATAASSSYSSELGGSASSSRSSSTMSHGEPTNLEAYVSEERSLHDHLEDQLHMAVSNPLHLTIAINLIDMVDETGYLRDNLEELAVRLGVEMTMIEQVLTVLQSFEPSGVCARSVGECLMLQLEDNNELTDAYRLLLENLDLIASHKLSKLKKVCGVSDDALHSMITHIRTLNPKPGLQFGSINVQPVSPDVLVTKRSDGSWHIELNSENLPRVLIDQTYYAIVNNGHKTPQDGQFLNDCLQTANWLVKSLDQRAKTILKVSQEIIRHQDAFFEKGVEHLRPLNLKTIADAIKMHESTVSRATAGKYMATSRGIFELRYFFTSSIPSGNIEDNHSSESVKFKIKKMIDNESVYNILSDDKVVILLQEDNIDIARRTVAKYRTALNIPSSVQRRREKKMILEDAH